MIGVVTALEMVGEYIDVCLAPYPRKPLRALVGARSRFDVEPADRAFAADCCPSLARGRLLNLEL